MLPWLPTLFSLLGILMILDGSWFNFQQVSKSLHLKPSLKISSSQTKVSESQVSYNKAGLRISYFEI